jgi:hypothetical protein
MRHRRHAYLIALLVAFVVGGAACESNTATQPAITPAESILLTCESYTSALNTLAAAREQGQLTEDTITLVDRVRATVNPLCLGPAPDVDATVKDIAIDAGVRTLQSIIAQVL